MSWLFGGGEPTSEEAKNAKSIFDFTVRDGSGNMTPMASFKGKKAYLLLNVASEWGLTKQSYTELVQLHTKYSASGLEILGFPCNNFGSQEPGSDAEIQTFTKSKYNVSFPILGKLECENGAQTAPIFQFLKGSLNNGIFGQSLKWNFTKFLCNKDGVPTQRFGPPESPLSFEAAIVEELNKN